MTTEIELKFRIPAERLAALRRAVATASARTEPLAALYFDTPDQRLAQARMALRLRREGATWVQTLKAEGADLMQRLEHNVVLGDSTEAPALDTRRHDGSEAGERLRQVLGKAGGETLAVRYATRVERTRRVLRSGGAQVELALDEGRIDAAGRSLVLCELELELLQGPPQALLDLAARWVRRFGLVLDVRSKSERGHLLAEGQAAAAPLRLGPAPLAAGDSAAAAVAAMLASCLRPVLGNASVLADAALAEALAAEPEYLHQLRVGLRALRSVLQVFGHLLSAAQQAAMAAQAPVLARLFADLGARRDQDVMAGWLWPALQSAGSPLAEAPAAEPAPAAETIANLATLLAMPATQQLWLSLLAASQRPAPADLAPGGAGAARPRPRLRGPLDRLLCQLRHDVARFDQLDDARRHRLRLRIKRLRYTSELSAGLWPAKPMAAFGRRLQRASAALGELNDTAVALAACRTLVETDPQAWFAVGWLSARRDALAAPAARALARLVRQPAPWRKR